MAADDEHGDVRNVASVMTSFFEIFGSNERRPEWKRRPEELATDYVDFFLDKQLQKMVGVSGASDHLFHLSLAARNVSLDSLTKRAVLVSDCLAISQVNSESESYTSTDAYRPLRARFFVNDYETELHGISRLQLGRWLSSCEPLLRAGHLLYYPNVVRSGHYTDYSPDPYLTDYPEYGIGRVTLTTDGPFDIVNHDRQLVVGRGAESPVQTVARPLMMVDIPVLEGTSLDDYCRIAADELEGSFASLQDHLRIHVPELTQSSDPREVSAAAMRLSAEISTALRKTDSKVKRVARKRAVQIAGACAATISAALFAFTGTEVVAHAASILGATGGLYGLITSINDYIEQRGLAREAPYYFLWVLGESR